MRGRKPTTGKYRTRNELIDAVKFFFQYQSQAQVARTCGVSEGVIARILEDKK